MGNGVIFSLKPSQPTGGNSAGGIAILFREGARKTLHLPERKTPLAADASELAPEFAHRGIPAGPRLGEAEAISTSGIGDDTATVPLGKRTRLHQFGVDRHQHVMIYGCLLYTSDAADDLLCVDLGGRRIIKKKKK